MVDEEKSPTSASGHIPLRGRAKMAYGDELLFQLWRAPRVLLIAFLAPFGVFFLLAAYSFIAWLPMSWTNTIEQPGAAAQQFSAVVCDYAVSWLPFTLPIFFCYRLCVWLRHRLGVGRTGITYEVTESGITSEYGDGPSILMPWSKVKCLARTKRLLLLHSRHQGWWYVPWHAFDAANREQLWTYAQQCVGATSKGSATSA